MWSFTLRKIHNLQVSENKVLSKICGLKKDEESER
jgi:hypothetical protein